MGHRKGGFKVRAADRALAALNANYHQSYISLHDAIE